MRKRLCSMLVGVFVAINLLPSVVAKADYVSTDVPFYEWGRLRSSDELTNEGTYKDTYTFYGNSGDEIRFDMESDDFDSTLVLLDRNGKRIAEDDDSGPGVDARITYELQYTGKYSIVATQYKKETGSYELGACINKCSEGTDDYGDSRSTAKILTGDDETINGRIDWKYDSDFFEFEAPVDGEYVFRTTGDIDTVGALYDSKGNLIKEDDESGTGNNFRIERRLTGGETYYIEVFGYDKYVGGAYKLNIRVPYYENITAQKRVNNKDVDVVYKNVECIADTGFRRDRNGFQYDNIGYFYTDKNEFYGYGNCFGLTSVAVLNYKKSLPLTMESVVDKVIGCKDSFGYNLTNVQLFNSSNTYLTSAESENNINGLTNFIPRNVNPIRGSIKEKIAQTIAWHSYYQKYIKDRCEKSMYCSYATVDENMACENISTLVNKMKTGSLVFDYELLNDKVEPLSVHSVVPQRLYRVNNEDKYILQVYDPNIYGRDSYIEIATNSNGEIIKFTVLNYDEEFENKTVENNDFTLQDLNGYISNIKR